MRKLTISRRKLGAFVDRLILSTHNITIPVVEHCIRNRDSGRAKVLGHERMYRVYART